MSFPDLCGVVPPRAPARPVLLGRGGGPARLPGGGAPGRAGRHPAPRTLHRCREGLWRPALLAAEVGLVILAASQGGGGGGEDQGPQVHGSGQDLVHPALHQVTFHIIPPTSQAQGAVFPRGWADHHAAGGPGVLAPLVFPRWRMSMAHTAATRPTWAN